MRLTNKAIAAWVLCWLPLWALASDTALSTEEGIALAKRNVCLSCHQMESKRVGPSFKAIAEKHPNEEASVADLAQVIRQGSRGRWGIVAMPPQRRVTEEDARKLAQWILNLSP